jgi:hypothetical protein
MQNWNVKHLQTCIKFCTTWTTLGGTSHSPTLYITNLLMGPTSKGHFPQNFEEYNSQKSKFWTPKIMVDHSFVKTCGIGQPKKFYICNWKEGSDLVSNYLIKCRMRTKGRTKWIGGMFFTPFMIVQTTT